MCFRNGCSTRSGKNSLAASERVFCPSRRIPTIPTIGTNSCRLSIYTFHRATTDRIRLQPANAALRPIYVDPDGVRIQGVVIGVLRKY